MTESEAIQVIKAHIEAIQRRREVRDFIPFEHERLEMRKERDRAYRAANREARRAYDAAYSANPQNKIYKKYYDKVRRLLRKQRDAEARLLPNGPCHWVAVIDGVRYSSGGPTA